MEESDHRNTPEKKKKVLIAMTSEFKLPLEDCHENLGKNPSTK